MKPKQSTVSHLLAVLALAASGAALASGTHAGSHNHDGGGAPAIGQPGSAAQARRSVAIEMSDAMRFTPARLTVRQGETVRLLVRNTGQIRHEINLGTRQELLEHLEQMRKHPDMAHDEPGKLTLEPGQQGEIVWQFTRAGVVDFGCLIPGHYEAGMKGVIVVSRDPAHH